MCFFFAFSEGVTERKKGRHSHKNTTRERVLIYSVFTHTKHTERERERTAAFAAFEENLREF